MWLFKFEDIENLKDDWNSSGAKPFAKEHVELAKKFYSQLKDGYEVYPTARNSIQIEYEDDKEYIEFEVYADGMIKMFTMDMGIVNKLCEVTNNHPMP